MNDILIAVAVAVVLIAAAAWFAQRRSRRKRARQDGQLPERPQERGCEQPGGDPGGAAGRPRPERRAGEPHHILVVDDQPPIRLLLAEVFRSAGLVVHEAGGGREAVEQFRQHPIDFVLLDLKMPDMDGIEALRLIRQLDRSVEAVIISAYGDAGRIDAARKLGVHKFFTKPFDIEQLREYVLQRLDGRG